MLVSRVKTKKSVGRRDARFDDAVRCERIVVDCYVGTEDISV